MPKALIVDDSALMRRHLKQILEAGFYEVMAVRNGVDALEALGSFDPDVIIMHTTHDGVDLEWITTDRLVIDATYDAATYPLAVQL